VTYFGFLALFLIIPLAVLGTLTWRDHRRGITLPYALQNYPAWMALAVHVIVAVVYTTPWDNYLVATAVWWYDLALVTGLTIGWVPIEEYTFFVLQTFLAGLWLLYLARRIRFDPGSIAHAHQIRVISTWVLGLIWLVSVGLLVSGWSPSTYLALILVWALPPIMLQTIFGADILWRHYRLVLAALLPSLIYLSVADALAITAGTWAISPAQSLNIYLAGYLPVEEFLFFIITNTLVVFGMTLVLARESRSRVPIALRNQLAKIG